MSDLLERVAGAPITWGVDGSPGWGYLNGRDRVLREMVESGLSATELGPDGYLPTDPTELQDYLAPFGLSIVGGFVPALLYRLDRIEAQLEYVTRAARQLASTGSKVLVLGPSSHHPGYDTSVDMDAGEWTTFLANLKRLEGVVNDAGLKTALHPTGAWRSRLAGTSTGCSSRRPSGCVSTRATSTWRAPTRSTSRGRRAVASSMCIKDVDLAKAAQVRSGEVLSASRSSTVCSCRWARCRRHRRRDRRARGRRVPGLVRLEQDVSLKGEPPSAKARRRTRSTASRTCVPWPGPA